MVNVPREPSGHPDRNRLSESSLGIRTRESVVKKRETNREFGVERVVVNEKAPGGYLARRGTVLEIALGSRYGITFDNQKELTIYLNSECLDPAPQVSKSR